MSLSWWLEVIQGQPNISRKSGDEDINLFYDALGFLNTALDVQWNSDMGEAEHSTWHSQCFDTAAVKAVVNNLGI